ncbi:hypothetical protein BS50DRAFT_157210 [Corynespora cassiicola Philippines]|uniref:Uncharacterized protein n=1 Tax=Corynespora cassiicola Philippines TaxID=1448308 RepID=A0A2T2N764_CORCC|nr:hypothetical protein BS50DRAFT_157210 [Corynespora cassiicola Philippines]
MPVRCVGRTAHGPQPTVPASERRFDRSPYPHVRARAGANNSSFHSVAPASLDAGQPAYPLLPSQALDTPDLVSVDDVSGDPAERDGSWDPAGPASNATGNEDELIQNTSNRQETRRIPAKLELLDMFEWDQGKLYDESPPTCLHYLIK